MKNKIVLSDISQPIIFIKVIKPNPPIFALKKSLSTPLYQIKLLFKEQPKNNSNNCHL